MFQTLLVPGHTEGGSEGKLSETFKARLDGSVTVAEKFRAAIVIVSGRGPHPTKTEAELGYEYLRHRLPAYTKILKEQYSNETIGNYIFSTAAFIAPLRIGRVVTVTSPEQSNRCHQIAQHLWGDQVIHSVFSAIPETSNKGSKSVKKTLEDLQFEDLKRADFIADFLASGTVTLQESLHWLCENYENWRTTERYPTVQEAEEDSREQLIDHGWGPLVEFLADPASDFSRWWTKFCQQGTARRQIYRHFFEPEGSSSSVTLKGQLRRVVLLSIAEFGRLAERANIGREETGLILNYVPVKLYYCFERSQDFDKIKKEDALAFKRVLQMCLIYLKKAGRVPVHIWPGQGRKADSRAFTADELDVLLARISEDVK